MTHKLSASALSQFLRSPKAYYWRYIAKLEPLEPSVTTFDHDKIAGVVWSNCVDRFYKNTSEAENTKQTLASWFEQTDGWVPEKAKDRLTKAFETLIPRYYQMFSPDDGCRTPDQSEMLVENERFIGYLDGLSEDRIVHEVKMTSRSPQLSGQLWKVENSLQVRLYCVLTDAAGYCVEFAWKDTPHQIFRGPITTVTKEQKQAWETELNTLADSIYALGDNPKHYPCNPDSCCLVTKGVTSMCGFQVLCEQGLNEVTNIAFKPKTRREDKQKKEAICLK